MPDKEVLETMGIHFQPVCRVCKERIMWNRLQRLLVVGYMGALALMFTNCGGHDSSPVVTPNPVPGVSLLTPSTVPAGSRDLTLTVIGSNFISDSVVQWDGSARATTFVSGTQLTAAISASDLSSARSVAVSVFNPAPGGGTSGNVSFAVAAVLPLSLLTKRLPDASPSRAYEYSLQASGGIKPYSWSVISGSLPDGLNLAASGVISGTASAVFSDTTVNFTAQVSDYAYQPDTLVQPFSIVVHTGRLGRNDTCNTATPISNGVIRASISPYGDIDVYSFQGTAGARVTIEVFAQRLSLYSDSTGRDIYLDSLLELLNSDCTRITYNDDIILTISLDSLISDYELPYTGTYYVRVSDLRGDGRPDFIYELHLAGADQ